MNWGTMSRAERDAAYNNSEAVENSPALNAAREASSAAFRAAHPEHLDNATVRASATHGTCSRRRTRRRRAWCSSMAATGSATARTCSPV